MPMNLVIVESPAKAKTIEKYLGKEYKVMASYGHVRDLVPKEGAIDTENGFSMHYQAIEKNEKHVQAIKRALKKAEALYLATDPDREGEAISWHLYELLKEQGALDSKPVHRVVFHEITKRAIQEAIKQPRDLASELINAQQARRALDYLVGFNLSPLLWKKIRRGLSAGRVQSPALRLIVEREEEIEKFKPQEYWSIEAESEKDKKKFTARLSEFDGGKITQLSVANEKQAKKIEKELIKHANGMLEVLNVEKKSRKRNPAAPFITSTLQQEAVRKLGFTAQRAMRVAQQLYEGIDVGDGAVGLITYMRTDSTTLAGEAISDIRAFIESTYGKENLPKQAKQYKTRAKNAQEAHEAVRPTDVSLTPDALKKSLTTDQFKLYRLIWNRTVACQMIHATMHTVAVDLGCGPHRFRATGSTVANPGFMLVYQEGVDDAKDKDEERILPPLEKGDQVKLLELNVEQHFTEPPPRYSEASLVRSLEEYGIGRPSTYASIISTLTQREYVELEKRRFTPTDVGRIVNKFLTEHFTRYVDYNFTARLEDDLDAISRGEKDWIPLMEKFWKSFNKQVLEKTESVSRSDVTTEKMDENCPTCGKQLTIRLGKRGRFIGCSGFPDCDYTRNLKDDPNEAPVEPEIIQGRKCPKCESDLLIRQGRYGKFIGCSSYPKCKFIEPLEKPAETGVTCPECEKGQIVQRRSRRGKVFYSCSRYPDCKYAIWNEPINEPCPDCAWPIMTIKRLKRGTEKACPRKECGYKAPYDEENAPQSKAVTA